MHKQPPNSLCPVAGTLLPHIITWREKPFLTGGNRKGHQLCAKRALYILRSSSRVIPELWCCARERTV